jgi:hypothetical protein
VFLGEFSTLSQPLQLLKLLIPIARLLAWMGSNLFSWGKMVNKGRKKLNQKICLLNNK